MMLKQKHEEQLKSLCVHDLPHHHFFRLRFQLRLGQTEGVKKLRGVKKDIARMKTIARERELGLNAALHGQSMDAASAEPKKTAKKPAKKAAGKKAQKKSPAKKSTAKKTTKKEAR